MMTATMDLMAMYKYDPTLFDNIVLPAGIDRDTLINCLIMDTAEMEVIYPRPDFLKTALTTWSYKQLPVWTKLYESTMFEYNPIWNKDGTITEVETRDLKGSDHTVNNVDRVDNLTDKNTRNFQDEETRNLKDQETRNIQDENLHSVYGFNSSTEAPESKDLNKGTGTDTLDHTGTSKLDHTGTDTVDHSGRQDIDTTRDTNTTDTGTIKHERTEQGNIGLTSTQQLIKEEREVDQFNIYDYIINDFRQRFCLALY